MTYTLRAGFQGLRAKAAVATLICLAIVGIAGVSTAHAGGEEFFCEENIRPGHVCRYLQGVGGSKYVSVLWGKEKTNERYGVCVDMQGWNGKEFFAITNFSCANNEVYQYLNEIKGYPTIDNPNSVTEHFVGAFFWGP